MDKKVRGINATNREYIRYDQVEKRQSYRFSEQQKAGSGHEEFDENYRIRTCDLGQWLHGDVHSRKNFAEDLGAALQDIGFAVLENTGIDPELYDEAEARVVELFSSTPLTDKQRYRAQRFGSVNQGYFGIRETTDIHPDLVEGWVFCRRAFDLDPEVELDPTRFWPRPEFEPFFRKLCTTHEALILPVMQSILTYLGQDPHAFDERLQGSNFGLRLNYYPPVDPDDVGSGAGRLLGHEDVNLFTLLPAPRIEGLQVLNRRNFKWIRLHAPRGSIVLNTGDYMQRITNDRLPSTTHRVSLPRDPTLRRQPRASFPLNVYLDEEDVLEVLPGLGAPKYDPVKAVVFHTRTTSKYYGDDYAVHGSGSM